MKVRRQQGRRLVFTRSTCSRLCTRTDMLTSALFTHSRSLTLTLTSTHTHTHTHTCARAHTQSQSLARSLTLYPCSCSTSHPPPPLPPPTPPLAMMLAYYAHLSHIDRSQAFNEGVWHDGVITKDLGKDTYRIHITNGVRTSHSSRSLLPQSSTPSSSMYPLTPIATLRSPPRIISPPHPISLPSTPYPLSPTRLRTVHFVMLYHSPAHTNMLTHSLTHTYTNNHTITQSLHTEQAGVGQVYGQGILTADRA